MFYVFADGVSIFDPLDSTQSILSPKVTLELGKSGSFQFAIPKTNLYYNTLEQLKTHVVVYLDNTEIFRGRVLSISRGFNNIKTIYCEGILSYLVDSVQKARRFNGKAKTLYEDILKRHNAMVEEYKRFSIALGSFGVENVTVVIPGKKEDGDTYYGENKYEQAVIESIVNEWQTSYDYINKMFLDYLGGYLIAKYDEKSGQNYIDYISNDTLDARIEDAQNRNSADHEIEFGVNMLDFSEEGTAEDMFTVLIPLGDGDEDVLTIAGATNKYSNSEIELISVNGQLIGIADRKMRAKYGSIVKTHSFENVNKANTLFTDAVRYLRLHKNMPVTYTIKAVDLHFINKTSSQIEIGDSVKITSSVHGIDRYLLCTKIEYDLSNPANTSYTFGNPEQSLTERYKKDKDKSKKDSEHGDTRAAKGGGGAAGAAKDDAVDEAQGIVDKLYDAYIKVDDAAGTITMASLYHDIVDGKKKLKAMSGIDLEAGPDAAKVNIYTMYDDIGKANTRITQVSDSLHAEIEVVSSYSKGVNEALNTFRQYATDTYATQEMLSSFKTETSEALAGFKAEVSATYATAKALSDFKTEETAARAGLEAWATKEFAKVLTKAEYETKESLARTSIEQWANSKFASINIMSEYKTANGRTLAQIEQYVDANTSKIAATSKTVDNNATSISNLNLFTNKLESVLKATTNYNSLKWDNSGRLIGSVSAAGTTITSDALKAAINNFSGFSSFIDGKLLNSTASIYQLANAAKSEIGLIANFSGAGASLKLTSIKDTLKKAIESSIVLEADNISVQAKKSISLQSQDVIIDAMLTGEGTALFTRGVTCNSVLYANGDFTTNAKATFSKGFKSTDDSQINGNLTVQNGYSIKIGKNEVALKKDIPDVSGFPDTQSEVVTLLRGSLTTSQWITNQLNSSYTNWNTYIKDKIEDIVTKTYIEKALGCDKGLSDYISKHSAKKHTHTVSIGHIHHYTNKDGKTANTTQPTLTKFTTSSDA